MKLLEKILRLPAPPEVLALLEKIDGLNNYQDAIYPAINRLRESHGFTRYEKWLLRRAIHRIARRYALSRAMHVVVMNELPYDVEPFFGEIELTEEVQKAPAIRTYRSTGTTTAC